jgi:hypothetical protein
MTNKSNWDWAGQIVRSGLRMDLATSKLQKCIRMADAEGAMQAALDISEASYGKFLFRRLATIACEDLGAASPEALTIVMSAHNAALAFGKSMRQVEPMFIAHAIYYMCNIASAHRGVDHLKSKIVNMRDVGEFGETDDRCFDIHTSQGRQHPDGERGFIHFCSEAALIKRKKNVDDDKAEIEACHWCPVNETQQRKMEPGRVFCKGPYPIRKRLNSENSD